MTFFIDGYNLIFAASRRMPGFEIHRTEEARDKLIALLAKLRALKNDKIVVFFDGGAESASLPRRTMERGMEVVFSDARSDADAEIKNAVTHDADPRAITVVTSDAAIRRFVERYGAAVMDSRDFLDMIEETLKDSSLPVDEPIEKYGGAAADDIDYWLRAFGGDSETEEKK